jgi:hypothetical protein
VLDERKLIWRVISVVLCIHAVMSGDFNLVLKKVVITLLRNRKFGKSSNCPKKTSSKSSEILRKFVVLEIDFAIELFIFFLYYLYEMSRGHPRKYRTKRESKAAKKQSTKLLVTFKLSANESWYEREKAKRLYRPTNPLEVLQLDVIENMHHKLDNKNWPQRQRTRTRSPNPHSLT